MKMENELKMEAASVPTSEIEERAKAFYMEHSQVADVSIPPLMAAFHLSELARRDDRLREAEEVIDDYGNEENWLTSQHDVSDIWNGDYPDGPEKAREYRRKCPREKDNG